MSKRRRGPGEATQLPIEKSYIKTLKAHLYSAAEYRAASEDKLSIFESFSEMPFFIEKRDYEGLLTKLNLLLSMAKFIAEDMVLTPAGMQTLKDPLIHFFKDFKPLLLKPLKTMIARPDVIITANGFRAVELNVSSSVGGYVAAEITREYFERHPAMTSFSREANFTFDFKPFGSLFPKRLKQSLGSEELVLWDVMTFPVEDLKDHSVTDVWLKVLSPYFKVQELGGYPHVRSFSKQVKALKANHHVFRIFHPSLIDFEDPTYSKVLSLFRSGFLREVSSLSEIVISNKLLLADITAYAEMLLKQNEIQSVKEILPVTIEVGSDFKADYDIEDLLTHKRSWVLKKGGSYDSQHVFFGRRASREVWKQHLSAAQLEGGWVLQEFHQPKKHTDVILSNSGNLQFTQREVEIGPYLIDGKDGGLFCRSQILLPKNQVRTSSTAGIIYEKCR